MCPDNSAVGLEFVLPVGDLFNFPLHKMSVEDRSMRSQATFTMRGSSKFFGNATTRLGQRLKSSTEGRPMGLPTRLVILYCPVARDIAGGELSVVLWITNKAPLYGVNCG